mmetsp:Transcript_14410/g.35124  ORF Transcript_14410/g.35124 Transcript_14410/m.35124 type:complete len:204 (+) Transcript_14410:1391-2002(+)
MEDVGMQEPMCKVAPDLEVLGRRRGKQDADAEEGDPATGDVVGELLDEQSGNPERAEPQQDRARPVDRQQRLLPPVRPAVREEGDPAEGQRGKLDVGGGRLSKRRPRGRPGDVRGVGGCGRRRGCRPRRAAAVLPGVVGRVLVVVIASDADEPEAARPRHHGHRDGSGGCCCGEDGQPCRRSRGAAEVEEAVGFVVVVAGGGG